MGKRIHWFLLVFISALGLGAMLYFGSQPRPESRLAIREYDTSASAAQAVAADINREISANPLLLIGVEASFPDHFVLAKEFLAANTKPGSAYDLLVVDASFDNPTFNEAIKISTRDQFEEFIAGTEKALSEGKRVAVIVPTVFASQTIALNLAENYQIRTGREVMSFSISELPRKRTEEKSVLYPCIVEGVDQSGLGPFGCMVLTIARANYRKRFTIGKPVAILNQIGAKDFLFLYTIEK